MFLKFHTPTLQKLFQKERRKRLRHSTIGILQKCPPRPLFPWTRTFLAWWRPHLTWPHLLFMWKLLLPHNSFSFGFPTLKSPSSFSPGHVNLEMFRNNVFFSGGTRSKKLRSITHEVPVWEETTRTILNIGKFRKIVGKWRRSPNFVTQSIELWKTYNLSWKKMAIF